MPTPVPHRHRTTLRRPVLDGDARAACPEQLLLSALGLCMMTTFETLAAFAGIEVVSWCVEVDGTIERSPDGVMFGSIVLALDAELAGDTARGDAVLEDARAACLVLNSLRVPVVIEAQLRPRAEGTRAVPPSLALTA